MGGAGVNGAYLVQGDETFHYQVRDFRVDIILSVTCIPDSKFFILKGTDRVDATPKVEDVPISARFLILRGGEFQRNDLRIPVVFDNINLPSGNFDSYPRPIPYLLLNNKLILPNFQADSAKNQYFYHSLSGPTIHYSYTGPYNATQLANTTFHAVFDRTSPSGLTDIINFDLHLTPKNTTLHYDLRSNNITKADLANKTLQLSEIFDFYGPMKEFNVTYPSSYNDKIDFSCNFQKLDGIGIEGQKFDLVNGVGQFLVGTTTRPCTSDEFCHRDRVRSYVSVWDTTETKFIV